MRLNAINPKDNPIDEVLYCFGSAGDFDDSVGQNVGGGRDDSDDDGDDERDRVAKRAGVPKDTIVGSGPGGGNVVRSGDGTPVKAGRSVEREAEREGVSVEEINRRINDAYSFETLGFDEEDLADSSVLDEIAFEFDNIDVEPEFQSATDADFYEDEILRNLRRKGDYSSVFDLVPQEPDFAPDQVTSELVPQAPDFAPDQVTSELVPQAPDFVPDEVTEGLDAVLEETERGRAITELITAFTSSKDAKELPSSGDPQQQVEDLLASIGERVTEVSDVEPFSIERIQNLTDYFRSNPANPEILQTSAGDFPVSELLASTEPPDLTASNQRIVTTDGGRMISIINPDGSIAYTSSSTSPQDPEKVFKEYEAKKNARQAGRTDTPSQESDQLTDQQKEQLKRAAAADRAARAGLDADVVDDLDPRLFDLDEQADFEGLLDDTYDYPEIFDDPVAVATEPDDRSEVFAQARVDLGLPEDATVKEIQNALDARKALAKQSGETVVPDLIIRKKFEPDPDQVTRTVDEDTGLPVSARQAGSPTFSDPDVPLYGDEDYLDLYGAEPGVSLVDARLKAQEDLDKGAEEQGDLLNIPFTFVDDVLNQLFKADALTKERLEGGDFAIYSTGPTQEIIGSVNKDTGAITPSSGNFFNAELNPYYDEYKRQQELAFPRDTEDDDFLAQSSVVPTTQQTTTPYDFDSIIRSIVDGTGTETGVADGTESLPAIGQPAFNFMRDFGAFSLSPQPDDLREGAYSPTYLAPLSELTAEQRQELSGLLGTPLGAGLDLSSISFDQTPMETAEALIESLNRDQSS